MKGRLENLRRLKILTDAVRRAEEARLASIVAEETRLSETIRVLDQARSHRAAAVAQDIDAAARAGADLLWQGWADRRRIALNRALAQLRARKEAMRQDLQAAHGRDKVTESLQRRAARIHRREAENRRDQTS